MKKFVTLTLFTFIYSLLSFAGETFGSNDINDVVNKFNEYKKRNPNVDFNLHFTEKVDQVETCYHCPKFLNLTSSVNKILDKASKDPKNVDLDLPLQVKKLKMIYYVEKKRDENGNFHCQKYEDINLFFDRDVKMEGQAKLIAEEAFSFPSIESMVINNPENERIVYYFRDPNQKNVFVQVVLEKDKTATLRYYSYTPTEAEANPYNLPDLGATKTKPIHTATFDKPDVDPNANKETISSTAKSSTNKFEMNFDPKLERRGILPRDYHLGTARISKEIVEGMVLTGGSSFSVGKGSDASFKLTNDKKDLVIVSLQTKLNGNTEHHVIVPYEINVGDMFDADTKIKGTIQDETHATSATLSLTDKNLEIIRTMVRENKDSGKVSVVMARDFNFESKGTVSVQAGVDEASTKFVALRNAMNLNKTTSMAVDVKLDNLHHASIYYTLSSHF